MFLFCCFIFLCSEVLNVVGIVEVSVGLCFFLFFVFFFTEFSSELLWLVGRVHTLWTVRCWLLFSGLIEVAATSERTAAPGPLYPSCVLLLFLFFPFYFSRYRVFRARCRSPTGLLLLLYGLYLVVPSFMGSLKLWIEFFWRVLGGGVRVRSNVLPSLPSFDSAPTEVDIGFFVRFCCCCCCWNGISGLATAVERWNGAFAGDGSVRRSNGQVGELTVDFRRSPVQKTTNVSKVALLPSFFLVSFLSFFLPGFRTTKKT